MGNEGQPVVTKKLGFFETVQNILAKDGVRFVILFSCDHVQHLYTYTVPSAFWRGIGPALVLVINPIIQYTAFEQLKNFLIKRRTDKLRATGAVAAVAALTDLDFFLLGALSKLGKPSFLSVFAFLQQIPTNSRYELYIPIYVSSISQGERHDRTQIFLVL